MIRRCVSILFVIGALAGAAPDGAGILLVDDAARPTIAVSWTTPDGPREVGAEIDYGPPTGGEPIGANVKVYAAVGGTRVETGAGHPRGLVLRAGLTKIDSERPFFEDIAPGTPITIAMRGVRLREPITVHEGTGLVHLKYAIGDLKACSLPGTARNQYLLSDPGDTLGGRVDAGVNATPGALDGGAGHGAFRATVDEADPTRLDISVTIPYRMLRHLGDPWESGLPNTFFEPIHMHAELEVIPEDAEPLDRVWIDEDDQQRARDAAREPEGD